MFTSFDFIGSAALLVILAVLWQGKFFERSHIFLRRILLAVPVSFLAVTFGMCLQLAFVAHLYLIGAIFVLAAIPACYCQFRGSEATEPAAT